MSKLVAVCGLNCAACDAYLATQANDDAWKERVAARWRADFGNPACDVAYVTCDGCLTTTSRLGGYCSQCAVRTCGVSRSVTCCAYCDEYGSCATLAGFLNYAPDLRATLDALRQSAQGRVGQRRYRAAGYGGSRPFRTAAGPSAWLSVGAATASVHPRR